MRRHTVHAFVLCAHRRRQWWQRARCHDHLLSGLGLFRGVLYHKICRRLALCALVIFLAVHGSRRQQRVLDVRDGAGSGDYLESKCAGCGRCGARDVCGHCDYAAGKLGQRADDAAMRDGLPLATDDLGGDLAPTCSDPEPVEAAELTSDERLDAFVATFGLTERERDILEVLVVSDQSVQDIATTLFLSRSTLYRHISSINKKAGTASRVALINFFWSWTPKD